MTPGRRRLEMPPLEEWPRVGKIRLGQKVAAQTKTGESIMRPSAIDFFRVDPEDGITSAESATSFHNLYGDEPREIKCRLPGPTAADCFEGAWRLYGTRKLKRTCDGMECDERTQTGGWETKPCACGERRNQSPTPKGVCTLSWSLSVILPDVHGVGVWQVDTGSEISVKRVSRWLQMMEKVAGSLMFLEFTLRLVPVDVTPDGRTKTVYVLDPQAVSATPRELLTGGGRVLPQLGAGSIPGPAVPDPVADEAPVDADAPVDAEFEEVPAGEIQVPAWQEVLSDLRVMAPDLDDQGIGQALRSCFGRQVRADELGDPELSGRAVNFFLDRAERLQREAAAGDPDDPFNPAPLPGQEAML